jgi:hypothetical protein
MNQLVLVLLGVGALVMLKRSRSAKADLLPLAGGGGQGYSLGPVRSLADLFGTLVDSTDPISALQSTEEDIGFAPASEVAATGFDPVADAPGSGGAATVVVNPDVDVISQEPYYVSPAQIAVDLEVEDGGFSLSPSTPDARWFSLSGTSQVKVVEGLGVPVSTTPDVLGAYLGGFDTVADFLAAKR